LIRIRSGSRNHGFATALFFPVLFLIPLGGNVEPQVPSADRILVDVNLVVLSPTVQDRQGRFVSDLRQQDFEVYEDRVRQPIRLFRHEDIPVTVGLVVDHSGSMRPKLTEVIAAARSFVVSSNPEDELFVVNFNEHVTLGLPDAIRFTNRADELERAISKTAATGMTALYDAISVALERLKAGNREKKVLIVISDGGDNASARNLAQVLQMAGQSSALVYTIGIFDQDDEDRNPNVLKQLARETGGEAFFPEHLNDVVANCERIARDIRNQYTIGYASTNATEPGVYRAIRVAAVAKDHGKLSVHARAGYIVAGESHPVKDESAR
jgi:Ca-activated chloride channel family protein